MTEEQPADADRTPDVERTGDQGVDAVLAQLEGLDPRAPLDEHLSLLTDVHDALQRRLAAADG